MRSTTRRRRLRRLPGEVVGLARGRRRAVARTIHDRPDAPEAPGVEEQVREVRRLLRAGDARRARAIAAALTGDVSSRDVGRLCRGLVAVHGGYLELAWRELSSVPDDLWSRYAGGELVRSGVMLDWPATRAAVVRIVEDPPQHMTPRLWMELLEPVYGAGDTALAERLFGLVEAGMAGRGGGGRLAVRRDWMRRWVSRSDSSPTAPGVPGEVCFALMGYDHPGRSRASANIGDHIQTLASLGHLVRHQDVGFHGPQDLVDLLTRLQGRVRPDVQRHGADATVRVLTVNRDATTYDEVPERTWTLAFGWYMHALFGIRYGFPFHENLLPIFVSFHCNKRELLTRESVEYLRRFGPVGCRDWTTVDILLSMDVPAFFSGCLTTTVDTLFPDLPGGRPVDAPVAYVDVPPERRPEGAVVYGHSSDAVRFRSFTENVAVAVDVLETYRQDHSALVTSRLHGYLPVRSLGVPVDFVPKNRSDIRFEGLVDISDDEFAAIRTGIDDRLEQVFAMILAGDEPDAVYARWRELAAPEVQAARDRLAAVAVVPEPSVDLAPRLERAVADTRTVRPSALGGKPDGDVVHVAVPVAEHAPAVLTAFLGSLVTTSSRRLHVWLLTKHHADVDLPELARRFPGVTISIVRTGGLGRDLQRMDHRSGPGPDLDLLLLPRLLPGVDKVVVLPMRARVLADVAQLAELGLGGRVLAAPDRAGRHRPSGFGILHAAGTRLRDRTSLAAELRRQAHARHVFDFTAFSTDVMVVDLARMAVDEFLARSLGFVEGFGLRAEEVLAMAVGPDRAVVPTRWHCVPTRSAVDDPALVHWLDDPVPEWQAGDPPPRH